MVMGLVWSSMECRYQGFDPQPNVVSNVAGPVLHLTLTDRAFLQAMSCFQPGVIIVQMQRGPPLDSVLLIGSFPVQVTPKGVSFPGT